MMITQKNLITILVVSGLFISLLVNISIAQTKQKPLTSNSQLSPIDINNATVSDLTKLPGIGDKMANRIVDYRNKNGNFKTIEEIMNVKGINEKKYQRIKDYIIVKKTQAPK